MDPALQAEVTQLITTALSNHKPNFADLQPQLDQLTTQISEDVQRYVAEVTTPPGTTPPGTATPEPATTDGPTAARLAKLEKDLADSRAAADAAEAERLDAETNAQLLGLISDRSALHPSAARDLIRARLGELKRGPNGLQTADGSTLEDVVGKFFSSDEGKHFLPAPAGGAGTPPPSTTNGTTESKPDINSALAQAFAL